MNIHEYVKRHKEIAEREHLDAEISDEEYAKMFISHMVISEWQNEESKKQVKREKQRIIDKYRRKS